MVWAVALKKKDLELLTRLHEVIAASGKEVWSAVAASRKPHWRGASLRSHALLTRSRL